LQKKIPIYFAVSIFSHIFATVCHRYGGNWQKVKENTVEKEVLVTRFHKYASFCRRAFIPNRLFSTGQKKCFYGFSARSGMTKTQPGTTKTKPGTTGNGLRKTGKHI
jgi:hypothetical protein